MFFHLFFIITAFLLSKFSAQKLARFAGSSVLVSASIIVDCAGWVAACIGALNGLLMFYCSLAALNIVFSFLTKNRN